MEKENTKEAISLLLVRAAFLGLMLIPALVNQVEGEAQGRNTGTDT